MKTKYVYFIYICPIYYKKRSITIEYPKKIENKNEILWGIEYNDLKTKRQLIKNLNVINLELKKKEEIKFKFELTIQDKTYKSNYFLIPEKSSSLFVYNLFFEASGYLFKDTPEQITFI